MSDMVTHWASFEDCRRLAQEDSEIDPFLRRVIETEQDAARLGTIARYGTVFMLPILRKVKEGLDDPTRRARDERNLGVVLGALIHQACDNAMKPLLSEASGADWNMLQFAQQGTAEEIERNSENIARSHEVSAYYDAEVFREVYLSGKEEPMSRFFLSEMKPEARDFEMLVRAMFQRALLASHTLKPDFDNLDAWLDNLFERAQPLYLNVDEWVRVFNHPDPAKIDAYGVRTAFYNPDDPSIRAARLLQAGKPLDPDLRRQVYEEGVAICAYGKVLQLGIRYLRSATRVWRGIDDKLEVSNYESSDYKIAWPAFEAASLA